MNTASILSPIFPETENLKYELEAFREALVDFKDPAAAAGGVEAAAGLEAAARKLFLFAFAATVLIGPVVYYGLPKKMAWLKYALLGVLVIVLAVAAYVWFVTYSDLQTFIKADADAQDQAQADAQADADQEQIVDDQDQIVA